MKGKSIISWLNKRLRRLLEVIRIYKYRKILRKDKKRSPASFTPVDRQLEKRHKAYWSRFHKPVDLDFLRWYCNYSGINDHRFIPDDIYRAIVERILNNVETANYDMDKNRLDLILGKEQCARAFLKNVNGSFLSVKNEVIKYREAKDIFNQLEENLIIKPSIYTSRGKMVILLKFRDGKFVDINEQQFEFDQICDRYRSNYIIQEQIKQHEATAIFHPHSVNTFRINTYRSIADEKVHILSIFFKAGTGGAEVDNFNAGGLFMMIDENGQIPLDAHSLDKPCAIHPDSGIPIRGHRFEHMDQITSKAIYAASKFTDHRVLAHDIALDSRGRAMVIEVNILGIGVRQWFGGPFFGDFTDEIVEYCLKNRYKDQFKILRV